MAEPDRRVARTVDGASEVVIIVNGGLPGLRVVTGRTEQLEQAAADGAGGVSHPVAI